MTANEKSLESYLTVDKSFNILAAMMMRTGWTDDVSVLKQECLVVKPEWDPQASSRALSSLI